MGYIVAIFKIERKGDKGEKRESVNVSSGSVVPQINWKQCVWKSASGNDNGKIKVYENGIRIVNNTQHTTHSKENSFLFK